MKVGVIQLNSQLDKEVNLQKAEIQIDELAQKGCDLITLPEYFNFLGPSDLLEKNAEEANGPTVTRISKKASETGCYIHLGSFLESEHSRVYNSSVVFDKKR